MITIQIKTDNDSFQDGNRRAEVARILENMAHKIRNSYPVLIPRDLNGNTVGSVELTGDDKRELSR